MKKLIIALTVSLLMVFSAFVCYADYENSTEVQTVIIPAKKVNSISETLRHPVVLAGTDDSASSGSSAGGVSVGGGGGGVSTPEVTPVPGGSSGEDTYCGKIHAYEAYCHNFFLSENTLDIIVRFDDIYYIEDAREALKINVYEASTDELVATTVNAAYINDYNAQIRYTLMLEEGVVIDEDNSYYIELVYSGNADFSTSIEYFYIYPESCEVLMGYTLKDKSTATVDVKVSNTSEDAMYYAYIREQDKYYMPLSQKDGVFTFSFEDVLDNYKEYSRVDIYDIDLYRVNEEDNPTSTPDISYDNFVDSFGVHYEFLKDTGFTYNKWNGITIVDPIADGTNKFRINLESSDETNGATADKGKYEPEDADSITIDIYNETLGTKIATDLDIEICEFDKEEGYIYFGVNVTCSEVLYDEYSYYAVVSDKYSKRMKKINFTDGSPSASSIAVNGSTFESFTKADVYDISINGIVNMPDSDKFDIKLYNYNYEEVASFDRESLKITDTGYGISYNLSMLDNGMPVNDNRQHYATIYYDGELVKSFQLYMTDYYEDDKEEYFDMHINTSYYINDEKILLLAYVYTNMEDFDINDCEFSLSPSNDTNLYLDGGLVTKLYDTPWDLEFYLFEYDVTGVTQDYNNFLFRYCYNEDTPREYWFGVNEYKYTDSFIINFREKTEETYDLFGYNLPEGDWSLLMTDELSEEQTIISGTLVSPYHISFDYESIPQNAQNQWSYLECDGRFFDIIEINEFSYDRSVGTSVYSEFLKQNTQVAIINLPYKLYNEYRIAYSPEELDETDYARMQNQVVTILPDKDGKHYIYAQFIDEDGNESEVYKTMVNLDRSTPVLEFGKDLSGAYMSDNFYIETPITIDRRGRIYYQLYTKYGTPYEWESQRDVTEYDTYFSANLWFNSDSDLSIIDRIDFWFEDEYGNISETLSYNITLKNRYVYEYIGDGYIYFDTVDGRIERICNISGHLTIPSMIDGTIVRYIDSWVLSSYENLTSISIPSTVTSINYYSFYDKRDITFYVKENSYAHTYLSGLGYTLVITGNPGDINSDRVINGMDLLRLAKYFANWNVTVNEETADVNADGELTVADLLRLAKYLAGHSVVLGE